MLTNQNHQKIAAAFDRLFRTYPQSAQGSSAEQVARDRMERAKVYFEAVALYHEHDVETAIENFITGSAPGVNPAFAPPAPLVAAECRRVMNLRLDSERRAQKPTLPPPDIEKTPESRERVRAMTQKLVAALAAMARTDDARNAAERKRWQDRVDARFIPPQDEHSLRSRLHIEVGDPDGERDVA